jgi:hypothetical protein
MLMWGQPPSAVLRAQLERFAFLYNSRPGIRIRIRRGFVSGYASRHTAASLTINRAFRRCKPAMDGLDLFNGILRHREREVCSPTVTATAIVCLVNPLLADTVTE